MKKFFWLVTLLSIAATVLYTAGCRISEANRDFR